MPHRPISSVFSAWTFWIGFPVCRWRILGVRKTVPASICCFRHLLRARGLIGLVGPLWPPMRALVALVFDARRVLRGLLEDLLPFGGCLAAGLRMQRMHVRRMHVHRMSENAQVRAATGRVVGTRLHATTRTQLRILSLSVCAHATMHLGNILCDLFCDLYQTSA